MLEFKKVTQNIAFLSQYYAQSLCMITLHNSYCACLWSTDSKWQKHMSADQKFNPLISER